MGSPWDQHEENEVYMPGGKRSTLFLRVLATERVLALDTPRSSDNMFISKGRNSLVSRL
jgi:hypothetical protein